jgi:hypothetical protein
MKPTIGKSIFYIVMALAYLTWLPLINLARIMKLSINFYLDGTLSTLFLVAHSLVFFYMVCILRSKQEKRSIVVSFIIFVCLTAIAIPFYFTSFGSRDIRIAFGVLAGLVLLNIAIQSFRVADNTTEIGFKLLGITLAFKVAAQMGLPFIWGYIADNFSISVTYISYIPPILEGLVLLSIIFIFHEVLAEQKEQHYQLIHAAVSETYIPDHLDKAE